VPHMIEQLILARHGETVHNASGITQGWSDSALSDVGAQQVQQLAARIGRYAPTALYSSPLGRALSTAEAIKETTGLDIVTLDDVREMNYGRWEGCSFLDIRRDDHEIYRRWVADPDEPCPGGESHNDVRRRMLRAIESIDSPRPVIVTHGTAIRIGVCALLDLPLTSSRRFAQNNASINIFIRRRERWILKVWNEHE